MTKDARSQRQNVAAMNREFEEEVGAGLVEFGPDDYIFSNSSRRARQETLLLVLPQDELEGIFRDSLARVLGLLRPIWKRDLRSSAPPHLSGGDLQEVQDIITLLATWSK